MSDFPPLPDEPTQPPSRPPQPPKEAAQPPPPGLPPAGWYPDPVTGVGSRYWDGYGWTEERSLSGDPSSGPTLPPAGGWLGEALRLALSRAGHIFPLIVILSVLPTAVMSVVMFQAVSAIEIVRSPDLAEIERVEGFEVETFIPFAVAFGLSLLLGVVLHAALARHFLSATSASPEPWSQSLIGGVQRFVPMLFIGIVLGLLSMLLFLLVVVIVAVVGANSAGLGVLLAFVLGAGLLVLFAAFAARLFLVSQAVAGGPQPFRALSVTLGLTRGHGWALLGRFFLLLVLALGIQFASSMVTAPISAGFSSSADLDAPILNLGELMGGAWPVFTLVQLVSVLFSGLSAAVSAAGCALLYRALGGPVDPDLDVDAAPEVATPGWS